MYIDNLSLLLNWVIPMEAALGHALDRSIADRSNGFFPKYDLHTLCLNSINFPLKPFTDHQSSTTLTTSNSLQWPIL